MVIKMESVRTFFLFATFLSAMAYPAPPGHVLEDSILSSMKMDDNICFFPPPQVFTFPTRAPLISSCERPLLYTDRANITKLAEDTNDFYPFLCMGLYDVSMLLCGAVSNNSKMINSLPKTSSEFEKLFNSKNEDGLREDDFCQKISQYKNVVSNSKLTTNWVSVLNENLEDPESCKMWCIHHSRQGVSKTIPICKMLLWGRKLLYENVLAMDNNTPNPLERAPLADEDIGDTDSEGFAEQKDIQGYPGFPTPTSKLPFNKQPLSALPLNQKFSSVFQSNPIPSQSSLKIGQGIPSNPQEMSSGAQSTLPIAQDYPPLAQGNPSFDQGNPSSVAQPEASQAKTDPFSNKSGVEIPVKNVEISPSDKESHPILSQPAKDTKNFSSVKPVSVSTLEPITIVDKQMQQEASVPESPSIPEITEQELAKTPEVPELSPAKVTAITISKADDLEMKDAKPEKTVKPDKPSLGTMDLPSTGGAVDADVDYDAGKSPLLEEDDDDEEELKSPMIGQDGSEPTDINLKDYNNNDSRSKVTQSFYSKNSFEDAEDSHFFVYFLTIIALCILSYVVFHNKQKILALVLEGRKGGRNSRRRPSTSSYRKLDSNLEEAISSSATRPGTSPHVIY